MFALLNKWWMHYANLEIDSSLAISIAILFIAIVANYIIVILFLKNRMQREKELAYVISLKNAALNANIDATIIYDLKYNVSGFNQKYLEIWGFKEETMSKMNGAKILAAGLSKVINKEAILEGINLMKQNLQTPTFQLIYFKDGKVMECFSQPQILNNKIVGRVFNYRDITERYEVSKKLKESENKFRSLFENSPLGVVIIEDIRKPFQNVNKHFCKMLGYSKEELKEKSVRDITVPEFYDTNLAEFNDLENGLIDSYKIKKKYQRKSGETFWGNLNISVIRDEKGTIKSKLIMLEDINEQKEQEDRISDLVVELKLLNEELEQKIKNRTVDLRHTNNELIRSNQDLEQFAYIASHDLQEPLRMVGNFVQLLERQYTDKVDKEGKEYIHFIVDGVSRMSKLIQNLLKYSRVGRKESALRKIDLGKIVEAKLFGLTRRIKETNAAVQIRNMPSKIYCEPDQIGMVFFNLLTNALKFNTGNPEITIACEDRVDELLFSVTDNGIGIDKRYETKVFEIFKRLHRREDYEGTGIGLALCKKIIARHGGKIWFESKPEKGTTFYFTVSKSLHNEKYVPVNSNLVS